MLANCCLRNHLDRSHRVPLSFSLIPSNCATRMRRSSMFRAFFQIAVSSYGCLGRALAVAAWVLAAMQTVQAQRLTCSTKCAAVCAIRCTLHEAQNPLRLQLNARSLSWPQSLYAATGIRAPGYRTPKRRRTRLPFGCQRAVVPRIDASSGTSRSAPAVASASSSVDNTAAAMRSGDWASRAIAL